MQGKGKRPLPLHPIPKTNTNTKINTNNKIKVVYTEDWTHPRFPGTLLGDLFHLFNHAINAVHDSRFSTSGLESRPQYLEGVASERIVCGDIPRVRHPIGQRYNDSVMELRASLHVLPNHVVEL